MQIERFDNNKAFTFGDIIADARKRKGLTLGELAGRTRLSVSTLSRYERGERQPSIERFNNILKALGVELIVLERNRKHAE